MCLPGVLVFALILACQSLRQKDCEFWASLVFIPTGYVKNKQTSKWIEQEEAEFKGLAEH